MEQKKFRLRLNLFDGIVLALAMAVHSRKAPTARDRKSVV